MAVYGQGPLNQWPWVLYSIFGTLWILKIYAIMHLYSTFRDNINISAVLSGRIYTVLHVYFMLEEGMHSSVVLCQISCCSPSCFKIRHTFLCILHLGCILTFISPSCCPVIQLFIWDTLNEAMSSSCYVGFNDEWLVSTELEGMLNSVVVGCFETSEHLSG
jgi:hypothetical protein